MDYLITVNPKYVTCITVNVENTENKTFNASVSTGICRADNALQAAQITAARLGIPDSILMADPIPTEPPIICKIQVVYRISDGQTASQDTATGICITTGTPESAREAAKKHIKKHLSNMPGLPKYVEIIDTSMDIVDTIEPNETKDLDFIITI